MPGAWSRVEVEATVLSYFRMLELELQGRTLNKSEYRRDLLELLSNRSEGAIERKHQNISAILIEAGKPYIDGYKPLFNYQELLQEVVLDAWGSTAVLQALAEQVVDLAAEVPTLEDLLAALEGPPDSGSERTARKVADAPRLVKGVDYLAREARNQSLGLAGELFVINFEKARLIHAGKERLADRVTHVSKEEGDGAGFDIRSFEADASDRLIEVKTTAFGKQTPFYVTRNELRVSSEREKAYHLYRMFKFRAEPRLFTLQGRLDDSCQLSPTTFVASVR